MPFYEKREINQSFLYFLRRVDFLSHTLFSFAKCEVIAMAKTPEGRFKETFIGEIETRFPGCIVTKLEADFKNGIPDVLVLHKNKWATLECKKSEEDVYKQRPNKLSQDYYVKTMDKMSFSRYVYPENKEEVLNELEVYFQRSRRSKG